MKISKVHIHRTALVGVLATGLGGCFGGGDDSTPPPDTPPVVVQPKQEDKFGLAFGMAFRVDANSEPTPVKDGDLIPISFTDEPTPIT